MVTFLMLRGIVIYFPIRDDIGFLKFKKEYLNILPWKIAFYAHVFTVAFALIAGFTQFSNHILKEHRKLHRTMGKIYVYDIFINFIPAFIMAIYANGQMPSKIAFIILDCLWLWFTYKAVAEIKKGNVRAHKNFMIRSYALTLSAVTLRLWKPLIASLVEIDPLHLYMIISWMGFVPNLLFAEWLISRKKTKLPANLDIIGN
ncbi:DUF2306 domain-containing protein [Pedobacter frigiditerrae]|nr:DUF2306 domain-containing protein [Pedobacter frigiditerrae]